MTEEPSFKRRLATILAIDVAGYSHRVETDESSTLAALGDLTRTIEEMARRQEGRLFHTAGDGFLVEFPTVSGALETADTLRRATGLPLRMGVHIGEVSVTASEDLLGHGVNVAARLQAKAPINAILVSNDVVRAERGALSKRFAPAGRLKLDKMRETLPVFLFLPEGEQPSRLALPRLAGARIRWAAACLGVLSVVGAVLLAFTFGHARHDVPAAATAKPLKVTALPFQVLGASDPQLQQFVGGLQAEMVTQLSQSHLTVVEPAQAASATYSFSGTVERSAKELVVRIRLDEARGHVTVWSEELRSTVDKAEALQSEIANLAAHVANDAVGSDDEAKGDVETLGLLIKMDLYSFRNRDRDREEEWRNSKQLLAKLPNDPDVHSNLAIVSAFLAANSTAEHAAEMKTVAIGEANTALKLDPTNQQAIFALYLIYPAIGHWRDRELALQKGLKLAPQSGLMTNHYSNFLREVGRLDDAVDLGRQAAALRPPSPNRDTTLLLALAADQRTSEASELADKIGETWSTHQAGWNGRFEAMLLMRRWGKALALLEPEIDQSGMGEAEHRAWTLALGAMKSGGALQKREAVASLAALAPAGAVIVQPPHEIYSPSERIGMIAILGGRDEAFAEALSYLHRDAYADSSFLFWPDLADFRRDKRFYDLVVRTGLSDYWRSTGKWPDFCADKTLPYDCKSP